METPTVAEIGTHIVVTALLAGMAASAYLGAGLVSPREALFLWAGGTLGGILPDLDADHSSAVRAIFGAAGILLGSLVMVALAGKVAILTMWVVSGGAFVMVRYPLQRLLAARTRHRGTWHSLLAALFAGLAAVVSASRLGRAPAAFSWLFGVAVSLGFVIHLLLDEWSSVDLVYLRFKASFGSAFKLVDRQALGAAVALVVGGLGLFLLAPVPGSVDDVLFNGHSAVVLRDRFWPDWEFPGL